MATRSSATSPARSKTIPTDLSGPFHKYGHVRGKGFFGQTRRERRAYPKWICKERATKSGRKRTAALHRIWPVAALLSVTDPPWGMRPPRALPQAKLGA